MKRTEVFFDTDTVPPNIRQYIQGASMYDSSCSEQAKTYFVKGADHAFLKISSKGSLEREAGMTQFLNSRNVAPKAIAYVSDSNHDYLLTEAVVGEDGTAEIHLEHPAKLAVVFGEYLRMLHSLPTAGCPYNDRTAEMLNEVKQKDNRFDIWKDSIFRPVDNVIIHGDYCLPNIVMDHFTFKGFIDVGNGGVGDRHYDLYWGLWTLTYNCKTDRYNDLFLDAYGRQDVDMEGLSYFTRLVELAD